MGSMHVNIPESTARVCLVWQHRIIPETRVGREIEALAEAGHEVDVICLRGAGQPAFERSGRVRFRRIALKGARGGIVRDVVEHVAFFALVAVLLSVRQPRRHYAVIQIQSVPETLVFAAIVPRLLGARVVLDLLEPMPEFFSSRFEVSLDHPMVRVARRLEQASIRFADAAITCTTLMRDAFTARGASKDKVQVIHDGADERVFTPDGQMASDSSDGRFTLICHGTVEERYGLDTVIRAVALLKDELPGLRFEIVGQGSYLPILEQLALDLGVADNVYFSREFLPGPDLVAALAAADVGVVAMKRDAFRDLTLCAKLFDFISMRKPTIASRTRSVEKYFDESCLRFFTSDDPVDLARAIRELHADPELRRGMVERATLAGDPYRWPHERERYLAIIERQIERARPVPHR
jgi:glycosyltransferase involved in cell wall biosynthesis